MNTREKILSVFNNNENKGIVISPFIHKNFVFWKYGTTDVDLITKTIEIYDYFGFDLMHRNIEVRCKPEIFNCANWRVDVETVKVETSTFITTRIETPEKILQEVVRYEWITPFDEVKAVTEYFIKSESDFQQFLKYQPRLPKLDFLDLQRAKLEIGDKGVSAPWGWGLFNYAAEHRGLENLLVDMLTNSQFFNTMMDFFRNQLSDFYLQLTQCGVDIISYPGNLANGTVVGPAFFKEYIFPFEQQLINYIQERGTHVLYHNCGDALGMIDTYNELGIQGFETLTEPPYGDMDLSYALTHFNKEITLVGNVDQISFLKNASPKKIEKDVSDRIDQFSKRGNFILGTSDFLEIDTSEDNLFALVHGARDYR
jgi:uroporphyrinogen decarboxylase